MDNIIDIIIKIVATLVALGIGWVGRYLIRWIKSNLAEKDAAKLDLFVSELVSAAEQMYKEYDPDGHIRLEYVEEMLIDAGYEITGAVRALIESKVLSINLSRKSVEGIAVAVEDLEMKKIEGFTAEGGEDNGQ